tara:strand:- start:793 stop:4842 length:4050 start_codon:yes stop_codon:yes gene_type:complete
MDMSGLNGLTNQEMLEELNEPKYTDSDGDGIADENDAFPNDSSASTDTDLDGMPDDINTPSFITDGLIGYWKLDEASGNVIDSSNYNHTSTIHGNVTYEIPAEYGTGIHFDGDDDYIEINSNDAFNNSNLSISFWVNFSDLPDSFPHTLANTGLVCKGDWADEAWCIDLEWSPWTTPNLGFRFWHRHAGIGMGGVKTTGSIVTGEWIHVAATYDGSTSEIYLNGQIENSASTPFGDLIPSSDPIHIATRTNTTGYPIHSINGSMDDVRIYDNGFNSSEIGHLYNLLVEDEDDDNDGTPDIDDAFPLDPTEDSDFDGNGVGDNAQFAEFDLDGDGVWDEVVNMPGMMNGLANTSTTLDHSINSQMGTCGILNNGSMMCWGTGHYSNTAAGGWHFTQTPSYAILPPGRTAVEVSMGVSQYCVLLDDMSVACWGRFFPAGDPPATNEEWATGYGHGSPQIVSSLPNNAISVSVADGFNDDSHSCAIMDNGSVFCWGSNKNGQLGLGYRCTYNNSETPLGNDCYAMAFAGIGGNTSHTFYIGSASQMILPAGRSAVGLHLTHHRSLIVLDNHSMICYGRDCGASGDHTNYVYVDGGQKITAVFSGRVMTSDGLILPLDQFGLPSLIPHTYNSETGPFSEADKTCASLKNGSVACNRLNGYFSHPPNSTATGHTPHWYNPPSNLTAGGVQSDHWKTCAVLSNGDVECWGFNGGPHNPNWDGGWIGVNYYCYGSNDSNGCDDANFVLDPRRIVLPRPLMVQEMDLDGDGISKLLDRCPDGDAGWTSNSFTDFDGDGCRDATEDDDDNGDGIADIDYDCDGIGDEADPDDDNDGIPDETDTFPYNPYEWSDMDDDGIGDNCDCDTDGDGVSNDIDAFPTDPFAHTDTDGDGMPDEITGITTNQQGIGFVILSATFPTPSGFNVDDIEITFLDENSNLSYLIDFEDLPRTTVVTDQYLDRGMNFSDLGGDGATLRIADVVLGDWWTSDFGGSLNNSLVAGGGAIRIDIIDPNTGLSGTFANGIVMRLGDGDSASENFRVEVYDHNGLLLHNESFTTYSGPVNGGVNFSYWYPSATTNLTEDLDDDNDGILDINDAFPLDPTEDIDTDGDGVGDNTDDDDDGDGYSDLMDAFPLDSSEWLDTDGDVIGDNTDTDDDNDGTLDTDDAFPLDPSEDTDTDGDGVGDNADDDADGDGYSDLMDPFPLDSTEWSDTDFDGVGDNTDTDDDNDGSLDIDDAFPLDPSEDTDTDGDGVGDNADDDADGDGEVDNETPQSIGPLNPSNSLKLSLLINFFLILLATLVISSRRSSSGLNLVEFEKMPEPQITTAVKGRKEVLEKYLSQGYSPELANTLADNEIRKS